MKSESNLLEEAIAEMKVSPIRPDTLGRAETRILNRLAPKPRLVRRSLYVAAGLAAMAVVGLLTALPSRSAAAEIRQIAQNGDAEFHLLHNFEVQPDGTLKPSSDCVVDGRHFLRVSVYSSPAGHWEGFIDGSRSTIVHADGSAVVETMNHPVRLQATTAEDVIRQFSNGDGTSIAVDRSVAWQGKTVDRYTMDQEMWDGAHVRHHQHSVLFVDPATERPLEEDYQLSGLSNGVERWEYVERDPKYLAMPTGIRLYDFDEERAEASASLRKPGVKVTVGGRTVELLQLWIGEDGMAIALAHAGYSHPCNYGIHIPELDVPIMPGADQAEPEWAMSDPKVVDGKPVELFMNVLDNPKLKLTVVPDRATLEIPVCDGRKLLGYARFANVPVHRTWNPIYLLRPANIPFWLDKHIVKGKLPPVGP